MRCTIIALALITTFASTQAAEQLLEDYENHGIFHTNRFDNDYADSQGRKNDSRDAGTFAEVKWAAKWSGLASTGAKTDLNAYKTYQVDVMVKPGQAVEADTNFFFQLLSESAAGYAYWEFFVPQTKIKADGRWYRIKFPMNRMWAASGDGGTDPTDFTRTIGTVCGMTYDEDGDQYQFKTAQFDNISLSTDEVTDIVVELRTP